MLAADGPDAHPEVEAALTGELKLIESTGTKAYEPLVHVELAELARQRGDEETWRNELSEAHRLFTEIGAGGHAERLGAELAVSSS
jgi:hypothetical protein